MKKPLLLLLAILAAGCGEPPPPTPTRDAPAVVANLPGKPIEAPDFEKKFSFGLASRVGTVRVGLSYDEALNIFGEPAGATHPTDLPPSLVAPFLEARGWQTRNEGFGAILYKGRVASALYQLDKVTQDRVDEVLQHQRGTLGRETQFLDGKRVRYWFWGSEDAADSTMVCATEIIPGKFNVSAATGTQAIMSALGMTYDAATRDQARAERLLEGQKAAKGEKTANRQGG